MAFLGGVSKSFGLMVNLPVGHVCTCLHQTDRSQSGAAPAQAQVASQKLAFDSRDSLASM